MAATRKPPRPPAAQKQASKRQKPPRKKRHWFIRWTLRLVAAVFVLVAIGVSAACYGYWYFSQGLPDIETLADYRPNVVTQVFSADGKLVGEFFRDGEQRYVVPWDEVPDVVVDAFVAAEDGAYWTHPGIDFRGIVRAALANYRAGRITQGASTLTQQVAKNFLLTNERSYERKIREVLLSMEIEENFDKEYILWLYLNEVYLGHGAYGVQAAARLYFGKDVAELSLAEAAILAGLPQSPSRYSPNNNFESAKARQRYVLNEMANNGYISQAEADAAYDETLVFQEKRFLAEEFAPYFVEEIRRDLVDRYGWDTVHNEGYAVHTTMDWALQQEAQRALRAGVERVDHRIGWNGPLARDGEGAIAGLVLDIDRARYLAHRTYDPAHPPLEGSIPHDLVPSLSEGERTEAVVLEVSRERAVVGVGSHRAVLPIDEMKWAYEPNPDRVARYRVQNDARRALEVGDHIQVEVLNEGETWRALGGETLPRVALQQPPEIASGIYTMRVEDGAVLSMVGGYDYEASEFNNTTQATRQVGSTFKPLVYAASMHQPELDTPITPSTILLDAPIVHSVGVNPDGSEQLWRPENANMDFLGETTLRRGLILSRNIITIKLLELVPLNDILEVIDTFHFSNPVERHPSTVLGASSLTIEEMIRAYSIFPTLGDIQYGYTISRIEDRDGEIVEARTAGERVEEVIPEASAYVMVKLLQDVVRAGTATAALQLGVPGLAGKTGTTNDFRDAWFIGFTPQLITGVWVGYPEFRSMGRGQYGGECALPIWMDYMEDALEVYDETGYERPEDVEVVLVDTQTGLLARNGVGIPVAFVEGTEPTRTARREGYVDTADLADSGEF